MIQKDKLLDQLHELGIKNINDIHYNLTTPALYEKSLRNREGIIAHLGPLVVRTGQHTGRSPHDKFIVKEENNDSSIWWGDVNRPMDEAHFNRIYFKMTAYMQNKDIFIQDCFAGTDDSFKLPIRVITETAWHSLFARNMFVQAGEAELASHAPEFTIMHMPSLQADPETDGTNSPVFVVVNFSKNIVLIGGTSYAGEIKKSVFTIMNYLLPQKNVLSMHCSANEGKDGDVAVLFGLSGTGKTTLSADPDRKLIGDDEHGWSDDGVFNIEGGCYAKVIGLSKEAEPEIYETTRKFGTILENVAISNESRILDLTDDILTENTRAAYPISHIPNIVPGGKSGHPQNIIMLTADAFGVLPPISKLTPEQAMYHFLSGYTAKVAGTEKGVTEPKATFSTCFGAPFMVLHPSVYANLLGEKIEKHNSKCWLINTGWSGGAYGTGERIKIKHTRAMLKAALEGKLSNVEYSVDPIFGLNVPNSVPGIPREVLNPRNTWQNKDDYDRVAKDLAKMFTENFRQFENEVADIVKAAGPQIG